MFPFRQVKDPDPVKSDNFCQRSFGHTRAGTIMECVHDTQV